MPKAKKKQVVTVELELTDKEAYWLKGQMQNPLHGQTPQEESQQDREMRSAFWEALGGGSVSTLTRESNLSPSISSWADDDITEDSLVKGI